MKSNVLFTTVVFILLLTSCYKEPITHFGFDNNFDKNSQGLTIMHVDKSEKSISLTGDVAVSKGEVLVELINPSKDTVFTRHIISPEELHINESFVAYSGLWKLKYKSLEGEGVLTLNLIAVN